MLLVLERHHSESSSQRRAALATELGGRPVGGTTPWARGFKRCAALLAEHRIGEILGLAFRAFHRRLLIEIFHVTALPLRRSLYVEAESQRAFGQPPIVRHDRVQFRRDQLDSSEMHRVEGTQDARIEHAGRVEQAVVEADEVDSA